MGEIMVAMYACVCMHCSSYMPRKHLRFFPQFIALVNVTAEPALAEMHTLYSILILIEIITMYFHSHYEFCFKETYVCWLTFQ